MATESEGAVEFPLRAYRRPVRPLAAFAVGLGAVLVFLWVGGAVYALAHAPRWLCAIIAGLAALGVILGWLAADHRSYPAGRLRLDGEGLLLQDGVRTLTVPYRALRHLRGTRQCLELCAGGRRLEIDWPRFSPQAPREVVEAALGRIAAHPEGQRILKDSWARRG